MGWAWRRCGPRSGARRSRAIGLGLATMRPAKRGEKEPGNWAGPGDDAAREAGREGAGQLGWAWRRCGPRSGARRSRAIGLGLATMRPAKRGEKEPGNWAGPGDDAAREAGREGAGQLGWAWRRCGPWNRGVQWRHRLCGHGGPEAPRPPHVHTRRHRRTLGATDARSKPQTHTRRRRRTLEAVDARSKPQTHAAKPQEHARRREKHARRRGRTVGWQTEPG
ncbi:hypothetical protein LAUMK142_04427 [Mycobacterium pseudokansasii]|uniref:Uncharacterized protein n=1 Tax=Mycobacterium pseudokansasii TaxID=2341080 RepID=A0A498QZT9_9MYCO|nr:hypothetical protein LAUMK142_04427 [Mycobacterium pseudokansasii]